MGLAMVLVGMQEPGLVALMGLLALAGNQLQVPGENSWFVVQSNMERKSLHSMHGYGT